MPPARMPQQPALGRAGARWGNSSAEEAAAAAAAWPAHHAQQVVRLPMWLPEQHRAFSSPSHR
eukprot:1327069-Alexandrium_andersonii.AAC.1